MTARLICCPFCAAIFAAAGHSHNFSEPKRKPLTDKMKAAVAALSTEWGPMPYNVTLGTLNALEARGEVQARHYERDGCSQWQWRRAS